MLHTPEDTFLLAFLLLSSGGSNLISDATATDSDTDSE